MRINTLRLKGKAHCRTRRDLSVTKLDAARICKRLYCARDLGPWTDDTGYVIDLHRLFQVTDDNLRAKPISLLGRGCELYCCRALPKFNNAVRNRRQDPICVDAHDLFDPIQMVTMQHDVLLRLIHVYA